MRDLDKFYFQTLPELPQEHLSIRTLMAVILTSCLVIVHFFGDLAVNTLYLNIIKCILATPVLFICGNTYFLRAWEEIKEKTIGANVFIILALCIPYLYGLSNTFYPQFLEEKGLPPNTCFTELSIMVTILLIGKVLAKKAKEQILKPYLDILKTLPREVTIVVNSEEKTVPLDYVKAGNEMLIRTGEIISVDGIIASEGQFIVDEKIKTGNPLVSHKKGGDAVFVGTVNRSEPFIIQVLSVGKDTLIGQAIDQNDNKERQLTPIQKKLLNFLYYFYPSILVITLIIFLCWLFLAKENGGTIGTIAVVNMLIVSFPCALGIFSYFAVILGISKLVRKSILLDDFNNFERIGEINTFVFGQNESITEGNLKVNDYIGELSDMQILASLSNTQLIPENPFIANYFSDLPLLPTKTLESVFDYGIKGIVNDKVYYCGTMTYMFSLNVEIGDSIMEKYGEWSEDVHTSVWLADETQILGGVSISDEIRNTAQDCIKQLNKLRVEPWFISGGEPYVVGGIARKIGIQKYKSGIYDKKKTEFIKELHKNGRIVGMLGERFSESEAMQSADISYAIGIKNELESDVSKVKILSDDLTNLPYSIKVSRKTVKIINQNILWAFVYCIIGIPIAAGVLYPFTGYIMSPALACSLVMLSCLCIILNSLRLIKI